MEALNLEMLGLALDRIRTGAIQFVELMRRLLENLRKIIIGE